MGAIVVKGTLASAVADSGTFTVSYPNALAPENASPIDEGDIYNAQGHEIVIGQNAVLTAPRSFALTLGTSSITVTNNSGATWPAGAAYTLSLGMPGRMVYASPTDKNFSSQKQRMARMAGMSVYRIDLGAPDALVTNGVMAAQNRTNAGALVVNGSLASGGEVVLDRPRNVIVDSGGADTAVITVTGYDEYNMPMKENITLNGTTAVSGKKAFKRITALACDAAIANTAFIGTGDVLGLPVWLPSAGYILKELENGTTATAGTVVAGWNTGGAHTATGADVRGTYDPNSACDGDKVIQLLVALPDPGNRGVTQYNG